MDSNVHRVEWLAPWVAGVLLALPTLIARFPPMADLPLHEVSVALLRHWGDAKFAPPTLYFVNLGHSNQLFSLVDYALSWALPIAWATKVTVAAALVALPVAAARFADHVRAPRWSALLVAPVGLGWLFFWGLIQNIVGLAALLAVLPTIDRFAAAPTGRGALRVCAAMILLHFAHQAMQLIGCAAILYASLGTRLTWQSTRLRAGPLAFGLAVMVGAYRYAWHFAGPVHQSYAPYTWHDLPHKIGAISGVLFGGFEPVIRNVVLVLAVVPVAFAVVERLRLPRSEGFAGRLHAWRFELLALTLFVVYLAAPSSVKSTTLLYHRFLPPAWAIFAVAVGAGTRGRWRLVPRAACAVLPVASLLIAWPTFVDSHRIYTALDDVMTHMAPGSAVACTPTSENPPYRLWSPVVAMGYVVAEHGGRGLFDYTQSPISIVSQRIEKQWPLLVERTTNSLDLLIPSWDLRRFRYLLVLAPEPARAIMATVALRSDATLVATSGDWCLFESKHPQEPIDEDEQPLPNPIPLTLRELMQQAAKDLRGAQHRGDPLPVPDEALRHFGE
jgi:hypothetical protein